MTDVHAMTGTPMASLVALEKTLTDILESYRHDPVANFTAAEMEKVEGNFAPIMLASKELEAAIDKLIVQVQPLVKICGAQAYRSDEFKIHQKILASLIDVLEFVKAPKPSDVAEAKFVSWLGRSQARYIPVRQDYFSFMNLRREKIKRPDFIVYNDVPKTYTTHGPGTGPYEISTIESLGIDVKAFDLKRDQHGAYFQMPDDWQMIAQVGLGDQTGMRSFWCVVPPSLENFGILIDLLHLSELQAVAKRGARIYLKTLPTLPINLLHINENRIVYDSAHLLFMFNVLAGPVDYSPEFIAEREVVAIDILRAQPRYWDFEGVKLLLPAEGIDGNFSYQDPVSGDAIFADTVYEAALIELLLGYLRTDQPLRIEFLGRIQSQFPTLHMRTKHWHRHLHLR